MPLPFIGQHSKATWKFFTADLRKCYPLSGNLPHPANIEFQFELILFVQVTSQLNLDYYTMLQGACTVSYWIMKPRSATIKMIKQQNKNYIKRTTSHYLIRNTCCDLRVLVIIKPNLHCKQPQSQAAPSFPLLAVFHGETLGKRLGNILQLCGLISTCYHV